MPSCTREGLDGYLIPTDFELAWSDGVRGAVHFVFLIWLFVFVGLASDAFMNSVEHITSTTRTIKLKSGQTKVVAVWNPTLANLSLMALGSSAPEILLSCVELVTSDFRVGYLGPFTIVGSASFNLFMISAVCIAGMPAGQTRLIKNTSVFITTALFSLLAYIWLFIIVDDGMVTIAEGVLTFLGFPLLLGCAYAADKKCKACVRPTAVNLSGRLKRLPGGRAPRTRRSSFWRVVTGGASTRSGCATSTTGCSGADASQSVELRKTAAVLVGKSLWEKLQRSVRVGVVTAYWHALALGNAEELLSWSEGSKGSNIVQLFHTMAAGEVPHEAIPSAAIIADGLDDAGENGEPESEYSLRANLRAAVMVKGDDEGESGGTASAVDWALHLFSLVPKLICAFLPPPQFLGGYPCFAASLALIGLVTFFVEESANTLSCAIGVPPSVAAITLVALGTSLPDTLASRTAALAEETADNSVGNITGSNSVNVFLGIGLPWMIGAVYRTAMGESGMAVPQEMDLGFSVAVFEGLAVCCLGILYLRRRMFGYELGGRGKITTGIIFVIFWVAFIVLTSLKAKSVL